MASADWFKVYNGKREYIAACKHGEDAATVVSNTNGGVIKYSGRIVWREGKEEYSAGFSFDGATQIMWDRIQEQGAERMRRLYGRTPTTA